MLLGHNILLIKNLYLLVQPVCTDGRASDGYTTAELHYNVTYKYKDM